MRVNGITNPPKINNSAGAKVNNVAISRIGSWSAGGNLATIRYGCGGAGTQTAGLACGGYTGGVLVKSTEEYNGTSWSGGGDLLAAVSSTNGGAGTQTSGLLFGGHNSGAKKATNYYNGSMWTADTDLNSVRDQHVGCGTRNLALCFAGRDGTGAVVNTTEEYTKAV